MDDKEKIRVIVDLLPDGSYNILDNDGNWWLWDWTNETLSINNRKYHASSLDVAIEIVIAEKL